MPFPDGRDPARKSGPLSQLIPSKIRRHNVGPRDVGLACFRVGLPEVGLAKWALRNGPCAKWAFAHEVGLPEVGLGCLGHERPWLGGPARP